MESAHHRLTDAGELVSSPPATDGSCIAYLVHDGVQNRLCVIEGGAFHTFAISPQGLARIAEESTQALRKHLVAGL
jgi:hypothetical protein